MWVPTLITLLIHLVLVGFVCWGVDEINSEYTSATFMAYFVTIFALCLNNHYSLLAGLMYDREDTLKTLDERTNKEG